MAKKDLFYKLSYKEQLEEILETKNFSPDCKNLLLSMLYKLETSYNDYETVKRIVDSKKQMIEDVLDIIKECEVINLVNPNSAKMNQFKRKKIMFRIDKRRKKIEVEPNEKALLNAIYSLPVEKKVYLDEEHSSIRNSLPFILEQGKNIVRAEVIRDFDAWSWNTSFKDISNIESNLIYQNLQILIGKEFLEKWMKLENSKNSLEMLNNKLNEMLDKKDSEEFLNLIFKLSIIMYCEQNLQERKTLREELIWNSKELKRLNDTVNLVKEVSNIKSMAIEEIEKIDRILNDKELFNKELKKINDKEDNVRILMPDDLEVRLKRQRKRMEKQIKESNNMLLVKPYMEMKSQIIKENNLLKAIDEREKKEQYILQLQKYFIRGIKSKILLQENRKEIIDLMYIVRYYNFLPYFNNIYIKDIKQLNNSIEEIEDLLIDKLIELKIVNKFSENKEFDKKVIKKIFSMRMINLENIYIEFSKENKVIFYDVETIEEEFEIDSKGIQELKHNKKMKLFI